MAKVDLITYRRRDGVTAPRANGLARRPIRACRPATSVAFVPNSGTYCCVFLRFFPVNLEGRVRDRQRSVNHRHVIAVRCTIKVGGVQHLCQEDSLLGHGRANIRTIFSFYYVLLRFLHLVFRALRANRLNRRLQCLMVMNYDGRYSVHLTNEILAIGRFQ